MKYTTNLGLHKTLRIYRYHPGQYGMQLAFVYTGELSGRGWRAEVTGKRWRIDPKGPSVPPGTSFRKDLQPIKKRKKEVSTDILAAHKKLQDKKDYRFWLNSAAQNFFDNGYMPNFNESLKKVSDAVERSKNFSTDYDHGSWTEVAVVTKLLKKR